MNSEERKAEAIRAFVNRTRAKGATIESAIEAALEAAGLNELVEALDAQWLPIGVMYDAPPMRRWLVTGKYGPSTAHIDSGTMFVHSWLNKDELPTHCMALPPLPNSEACESREPISPDALREIADGIANQNHAAEQRGLLIAAALTGDKSNG